MSIRPIKNLVFGVCEPLPMVGFPDGEVTIHQNNKDFTSLEIVSEIGHWAFTVAEEDGKWVPAYCISRVFRHDVGDAPYKGSL